VALSRANDATPHDRWVSLLNLIFKRFYKNKKVITKTPRHQGKQDPKEIQNRMVLLKP